MIVASKVISPPPASVALSVIRLSTLASVRAVSSRFRTASSNVIVMLFALGTSVAPSAGLNVRVGAVPSARVTATV